MADTIEIRDLELWTRIGVPDEERRVEQRILATVQLELREGEAGLTDSLGNTVNYEEVTKEIQTLAKEERKTLEKFAEDIANTVLKHTHAAGVTVALRKFILPGTREVACTIARGR